MKKKKSCIIIHHCKIIIHHYDPIIRLDFFDMNHIPASLFPLPESTTTTQTIMRDIISDKWSKYTVVSDYLDDSQAHKLRITVLKKDKYFAKATHNSYAWRVKLADWSIMEWKNDDGESGAGQIILTEMKRVNAVNMIVVVTRYFGWVMLYGDRFKHVVDAAKMILNRTI